MTFTPLTARELQQHGIEQVEVPLRPPILTQYTYENHDLESVNTLWECEDLVMFQSASGRTEWHGNLETLSDDSMQIMFNARGRDYPLRSVVLYPLWTPDGREIWFGTDYRGRQITLTKIGRMRRFQGKWIREQ